jgi:hypothetical protein
MKFKLAPQSIKDEMEARYRGIATNKWTKSEKEEIEVNWACLRAPTSAESETASFPVAYSGSGRSVRAVGWSVLVAHKVG